jgi:hypothetical protein
VTEKNYTQTAGGCKDCTLLFNCFKNKENMKKFLLKIGIVCSEGKCLEVVVVQPELGIVE